MNSKAIAARLSPAARQRFRRRGIVLVTIFASAVMFLFFTGIVCFSHAVSVVDDGETGYHFTSLDTPEGILAEQGYTLGQYDELRFTGFDGAGLAIPKITLLRAFDVDVKVDGGVVTVPVAEGTVSDVLARGGIDVTDDDLLSMSLSQQVSPGDVISISRITYAEVVEEREIPFDTVQVSTAALKKGASEIAQEGVSGTLRVTSKQTLQDGVVVEEKLLEETVTLEPVDAVVQVGTAMASPISKLSPDSLTLDEKGVPLHYSRVITGKSAAYTAGPTARTASGRKAEIGTVAVNPSVIPYGTKLYIVSSDHRYVYGYAIAADTGTALMDGRIVVDLYFGERSQNYAASCKWGIKTVDIYVLE